MQNHYICVKSCIILLQSGEEVHKKSCIFKIIYNCTARVNIVTSQRYIQAFVLFQQTTGLTCTFQDSLKVIKRFEVVFMRLWRNWGQICSGSAVLDFGVGDGSVFLPQMQSQLTLVTEVQVTILTMIRFLSRVYP